MSSTDFILRANDMAISVRQSDGKGMPLLLLHGSGASKDVFRRQFDSALGEIYQVTAIDLPGHGKSDDARRPEEIYTITGLASMVDAVTVELGLVRPVIFGWSLGGHVAIEMAAHRADIAGIALTGTPPIGSGPVAGLRGFNPSWDILLASREVFSKRHAERYMHLCFGDGGTPEILAAIERSDGRMRTNVLRSLMRGAGVNQQREVESNPVPLAMINGARDPIVRRSYIEHLSYANLWRSACQFIDGAGHAPFWERPVEFNRMLHAFLKDVAIMPAIEGQSRAARA